MKTINKLTLQFIPFTDIEKLDSSGRIKKLLDIILKNKIIILQGKLKADEEARLIEDTMVLVRHIKGFKGVELVVISEDVSELDWFSKFKHGVVRALGQENAITIIGPASVIREIKRDPKKIELFLNK
jgi:hypothetical protein